MVSAALLCATKVTGFVSPSRIVVKQATSVEVPGFSSSTTLSERRWNFNDGQGPFGMKQNAETWNGRVAQVCFVIIFLQELIQGKGVIQGIQEGDPINVALAGVTLLSFAGLTAFLAFKGKEDYVAEELDKGP